MSETHPPAWPRAGGAPVARARLREAPEDFQVEEILGFSPAGRGQHVLLQVRKRGANTQWVARRLAQLAGLPPRAVGYAGLKDRNAVTCQWFSVDLAGRAAPDWTCLAAEGITVLQAVPHDRKLRHGAVRANRFRIRLRRVEGDRGALAAALSRLATRGAPNYFGPQRFGGGNLRQAAALLLEGRTVADRFRRGIYLSAARAWLFNKVLAARVEAGNWDRALPGDVLMLDGRHSLFPCEAPDEAILRRIGSGELHPTGPLWGEGKVLCSGPAAALEGAALAADENWCAALAAQGLKAQRRALRVMPRELTWDFAGGELEVSFTLAAGSYATSVLREVVDWT